MDIQFVLDPYACAVYILSYITKGQRGMSKLLRKACEEAKEGNKNIASKVRHIGNKFLNAVEISAQGAVYLVLQIPLRRSSREFQFINTSDPDERTFLRYLNAQTENDADDISVVKVAPTGKAAFNIRGNTIHSAFKIPANKGFNYCTLDRDGLNTIRAQLQRMQVVFIDEISMVSSGMFNFLDLRLQQIMGTKEPFGGLSIITCFNLNQFLISGYLRTQKMAMIWLYSVVHRDHNTFLQRRRCLALLCNSVSSISATTVSGKIFDCPYIIRFGVKRGSWTSSST